MAQGKRWCFTAFYDDEPNARLALATVPDLGYGTPAGTYGGAQLEVCPTTGRWHMQGWCGFPTNKRLSNLKAVHPTAHWEPMRGTLKDNQEYCSKSQTSMSDYVTWGDIPADRQGKRNDLDSAVATLMATEGTSADKVRAVAHMHGSAFVKHYKGFQVLADITEVVDEPEEPVWRPWQMSLKLELDTEPDDRHIIWYNDPAGGQGKSRFVSYYTGVRDLRATALSGKLADMRYAYMQCKARIVFFDVARAEKDFIGHMYSMAEELKNGRFMNTKYESRLVTFKPPHVVFFANMPPDEGKWSADRLLYREFGPGGVLPMINLVHGGEPFAHASLPIPAAAANGGAGAPIDVEDFHASQLSLFNGL